MGINRLTNWLRNSRTARKHQQSKVPTKLKAERLEERDAPAIFTVTWDGKGPRPAPASITLQEAIVLANANPGADQITYGNNLVGGAAVTSSDVTSGAVGVANGALPVIIETLTIDGTTTAGGKAVVNLLSASKADAVLGFHITDGAGTSGKNSIIRNMTIQDPGGAPTFNAVPTEFGIKIATAGGNVNTQFVTILGIDGDAVQILNSTANIIGGAGANQKMVIGTQLAPNNGNGVFISGAGSTKNLVQQSTITANAGDGVLVVGANDNIVGGFTSSPVNSGNIIFLNAKNGVHFIASSNGRIQRNSIGHDGAGTAGLSNAGQGVLLEADAGGIGSANNIIGGNDLTAGNNIGGNTENGIYIKGVNSSGNQIQSNLIGISPASFIVALPNGGNGILVEEAANTFLGSTTTAANYISGNNLNGIVVSGLGTAGSIVVNNRIGITSAALPFDLNTKLGNVQDGVLLVGVTNVTVGGSGTNAPNIIGANRNGINIQNSKNVLIRGNQLGINKLTNGTYPNLGNLQDGVLVDNSTKVTIGGTQSLEGNKMASNRNGVHVINNSDNVVMMGNFIGTNLTGTIPTKLVGLVEDFQPVFQAEDGVLIEGSTNIFVGTPAQGGGNLISNNRHGVSVTKGSSKVTIQNNLIGTQSAPAGQVNGFSKTTHDLGNQDDGIFIDASTGVLIGGTGPFNANVLAKNLDGIQISGGSSNVVVQQNLLRNNRQSGVRIEGSFNNTIGGATQTSKNIINNRRTIVDSTFSFDGVFIVAGQVGGVQTSSTGNIVQGNYIGTDSTSTNTLFLAGNGVLIDGSFNNKIGITSSLAGKTQAEAATIAAAEGNVIGFSTFNGVAVVENSFGPGSANGNTLSGNSIWASKRLGIDLNNTSGAVDLNDTDDPDVGANNTQNFPVVVLAQSQAAIGTRIQGTFNSTPNRTFRLEFYHNPAANPTGTPPNYGQGQNYVGFIEVTTDAGGDAAFTYTNANVVLPASEFISGIAIDLTTGDTSEFGLDQVIEGAPGPVTYVVNNDGGYTPTIPADNPPPFNMPPQGTMTLATAIRLANEHPGADRIVFALPPAYTIDSNGTITYLTEVRNLFTNGDVPDITDTVIIDGSPFAWPQTKGGETAFPNNYTFIFNKGSHGLRISDNPTKQALFSNPNGKAEFVVFRHFNVSGGLPGVGVEIATKHGNANLQDMNVSGWGADGIRITNSPNNIIGGSGTGQGVTITTVSGSGVNILGAASTKNLVQQTNIGFPVGASGTGGPGGQGIWIQSANDNIIGGFTAGTGVRIQGAGANGIYLIDSNNTVIQGSIIGDTTNKFANHFDGIRLENALNTLIGGVNPATGNIIAGNTENGIHALNFPNGTPSGLRIQSNQIGTSGASNAKHGIFIENVPNVLIGSTVTAANNVDGNNLNGILIQGTFSAGARIVNTSVGKGGGNNQNGIVINGVSDVTIGGTGASAGGSVNNNTLAGIRLENATKINIQQMTINNNAEEGIRMSGSKAILIGGTSSAAAGNKINNNKVGVLATAGSDTVTLQGNTILNSSEDGVLIDNTGNVAIGTPAQFGGNLIGGNRTGVHVINASNGFSIQNNIIGTNGGAVGVPNTDDGIWLDNVVGAIVGGTAPNSSNFVSANKVGLHLSNGTTGTVVFQNVFANSVEAGVVLEGSSNNIIGGDKRFGLSGAKGNVISSNKLYGILLKPDFSNPANPIFSNFNVIQGNNIGVDQAGKGNFGNTVAGIFIDSGSDNKIGGTVHNAAKSLDEGNIIANTGAGSGVVIVQDSALNIFLQGVRNTIIGNGIFNNAGLGIEFGSNNGTVVENDTMGHVGPNHFVNYPVIDTAEVGLVSSVATGKLDSLPNHRYRLEFFGDTTADPSGFGEGKTYLGFVDVDTDAAGHADWNFFGNATFAAGGSISGTATDLGVVAGGVIVGVDDNTGDTSQFSKSVTVTLAQGKIQGVKFEDLNGNGIFDPGEPGLAGWTIELDVADAAGNFDGKADAKAVTGGGGAYSFSTLTDGKYQLKEVLQTGWIQTVGPTPNPMQITGGVTLSNVDFGNFHLVRITGHKFEDKNGNAVKDAGEGPIAGVTINLLDAKTNKVYATTLTDLNGNYAFSNLFIGKFGATDTGFYRVREVVPAGYSQTTPNPADFQIVSGVNVGPLDFGNKKTTGGGGGVINPVDYIIAGSGPGNVNTVRVFRTKTQTQVFSFQPYGATFTGGVRVAKGDVNGDNQVDIIVAPGAGASPMVKVYDGTNGKLMKQFLSYDNAFKSGVFVAAGDVNGDGAADIITGAGGIAPHVKVFDGKTGVELASFLAIDKIGGLDFKGGVRVGVGDVNADGFADVITAPGTGMAPQVRVWDGSNIVATGGALKIREFTAFEATFKGGLFLSTGKINGDDFADIIVAPDAGRRADVKVYDGATGKQSYLFTAAGDPTRPSQVFSDPAWNAGVHVTTADLNGDGLDDVVTGPGILKTPKIRGYDPRTGKKLVEFAPFPTNFLGGVWVG